jgi:NAD(P)-dependent dehydrogenase (short-subunit alcohol dehydrogenase family)
MPFSTYVGIVGSGVALRLLQEGATVVSPVRSVASKPGLMDELAGLQLTDGQLHTPVCDYSTPEGVAALVGFLKETYADGIDLVVSSFGGQVPIGALGVCEVHVQLVNS